MSNSTNETRELFTKESPIGSITVSHTDKAEYVMHFALRYQAKLCWYAISRSGCWSGVLCEALGTISYPDTLTDEEGLGEIADQYLAGHTRFVLRSAWDFEDEDLEDEENGGANELNGEEVG